MPARILWIMQSIAFPLLELCVKSQHGGHGYRNTLERNRIDMQICCVSPEIGYRFCPFWYRFPGELRESMDVFILSIPN